MYSTLGSQVLGSLWFRPFHALCPRGAGTNSTGSEARAGIAQTGRIGVGSGLQRPLGGCWVRSSTPVLGPALGCSWSGSVLARSVRLAAGRELDRPGLHFGSSGSAK